jgi:tetratricopeptide (TPR) repeat protein
MAKSNRQRKLDRAKRQARDSQKQTATRRRLEWQLEVEAAAERLKRLSDPDSPVADTADLLNETYGGGPISTFAVSRMRDFGWSTERLTELATAMLASSQAEAEAGQADKAGERGPSLTALSFAALAAHAAGDRARANELMDQALAVAEASDDSGARLLLTGHLREIGRLPEAIETLEARLREDPDDDYAAESYGTAISEAYEQVSGPQPEHGCPCGSGASWDECCGPRERAALSRFTDRSGLTELTEAVSGFLSASEQYGRAVDDEVARHLDAFEDVKLKPDDLESFRALVAEHALLTATPETQEESQNDEALSAIGAFAADPSVPAELAARARAWRDHFRYGLWKLHSDPQPPGLWSTEICTGELRYADFPAQFTDGWPRWSVWLGGMVPVDGIWRATGTGLRLSPAEADAAAEFVETAVVNVVHSLAGKKKPLRRSDDRLRIGAAEPHGVLSELQDPMPPHVGSVTRMALASLLWRIFLEVQLNRRTKHPRSAPLGKGQEKDWLDEPQTTLHGRTPRQSAVGQDQARLESMLRQFEYEADELAAQGKSQRQTDTDWLREELDMPVLSLDD